MTDIRVTLGSVSLPTNTSGTLYVYEDVGDDGGANSATVDGTTINYDNTDSVALEDGQPEYTVSGFDGASGNRVWIKVAVDTTDVTKTANVSEAVDVSSGRLVASETADTAVGLDTAPVTVATTAATAESGTEALISTTPVRQAAKSSLAEATASIVQSPTRLVSETSGATARADTTTSDAIRAPVTTARSTALETKTRFFKFARATAKTTVKTVSPVFWSFKKKIVVDHTKVKSRLTDFPVLIHLESDSDLATNAQPSGDDIKFEDANGTQLPHEIESYDSATGTLWAHVKLPSVSASSDTTIYCYYGNRSASNQEDVTNVWDADYGAVWHFNDDTGDLSDSTGNGNNGNVPSAVDRLTDAEYGPAFGFSDEVIDVASISSELNFTETFTITAVVEIEQEQRYPRFLSRGGSNEELDILQWIEDFSFRLNGGTDVRDFFLLSGLPQWFVVSFTYDYPNDIIKSIDGTGSVVNSASGLVQLNTGSNTFRIGAVSNSWEAKLSRVEISQTARTDAWVAAENRNKNDPQSFYAVGEQVQIGQQDLPTRAAQASLSTQSVTSLRPTALTQNRRLLDAEAALDPAYRRRSDTVEYEQQTDAVEYHD